MNLVSLLLSLLATVLSSNDPMTVLVQGASLVFALAAAYVSLRIRFGMVALLLLLAAVYLNTAFWIDVIER